MCELSHWLLWRVFVQTLIPNAPSSRYTVGTNVTQHFRVDVTDITKDLIISVSPLSGDPDLYVSHTSSTPGCYFLPGSLSQVCSNYTWVSAWDSREVVQIRAVAPCTSPPAINTCNPK